MKIQDIINLVPEDKRDQVKRELTKHIDQKASAQSEAKVKEVEAKLAEVNTEVESFKNKEIISLTGLTEKQLKAAKSLSADYERKKDQTDADYYKAIGTDIGFLKSEDKSGTDSEGIFGSQDKSETDKKQEGGPEVMGIFG